MKAYLYKFKEFYGMEEEFVANFVDLLLNDVLNFFLRMTSLNVSNKEILEPEHTYVCFS